MCWHSPGTGDRAVKEADKTPAPGAAIPEWADQISKINKMLAAHKRHGKK